MVSERRHDTQPSRRSALNAPRVRVIAAITIGSAIGLLTRHSAGGDLGSVIALLLISAAIVALAQQTIP